MARQQKPLGCPPGFIISALLASGLATGVLPQANGRDWAGGAAGSMVSIRWMAPARQSLVIQGDLRFRGSVTADTSTESDSRSPAEIFVLSGSVDLELLAKSLLAAYKDARYGGIMIRRAGNGDLLISHDKSIPANSIVIDQANKGTTVLNARSQPRTDQLVELLRPLLR